MVNLYNKLINNPEEIRNVISMYNFDVTPIPKKGGGIRPICGLSSLLNVFHTYINEKFPLPSFK